jgi:hypothetical protein
MIAWSNTLRISEEAAEMSVSAWTDTDTARALEIWAEYQRQHDVSDRKGQAVGIDPATGRIWFGESVVDIGEQLDKEGIKTLLYFTRVGSPYYGRKGGHR